MPELPKRKKTRLNDYDYSSNGAYFLTLCVKNKREILSKITEMKIASSPVVGASIARPQLSRIGKTVNEAITQISKTYKQVEIHNYVIMPNHIHLLLLISGRAMLAPTTSTIIQQFKGTVTKKLGYSIWQKSYHDRIIRNEKEYKKIYEYIENNPILWEEDYYHTSQ